MPGPHSPVSVPDPLSDSLALVSTDVVIVADVMVSDVIVLELILLVLEEAVLLALSPVVAPVVAVVLSPEAVVPSSALVPVPAVSEKHDDSRAATMISTQERIPARYHEVARPSTSPKAAPQGRYNAPSRTRTTLPYFAS